MIKKRITVRDVMEKIGGCTFRENADPSKGEIIDNDDRYLFSHCYTCDENELGTVAKFQIDASWRYDGGIGERDNLRGQLDIPLMRLAEKIGNAVGGKWVYDAAECAFVQA